MEQDTKVALLLIQKDLVFLPFRDCYKKFSHCHLKILSFQQNMLSTAL